MTLEGYNGSSGSAERIPIETMTLTQPAQTATLAAWLITAPGQHAAYDTYLFSIIHLRPIEGAPDVVLQRPGMTHELVLCGLDQARSPRKDDLNSLMPLTPLNASVQFISTDEDAIRLGVGGVRGICDGYLPAEGINEAHCQAVWTEVVRQTLEHMTTGGHSYVRRH